MLEVDVIKDPRKELAHLWPVSPWQVVRTGACPPQWWNSTPCFSLIIRLATCVGIAFHWGLGFLQQAFSNVLAQLLPAKSCKLPVLPVPLSVRFFPFLQPEKRYAWVRREQSHPNLMTARYEALHPITSFGSSELSRALCALPFLLLSVCSHPTSSVPSCVHWRGVICCHSVLHLAQRCLFCFLVDEILTGVDHIGFQQSWLWVFAEAIHRLVNWVLNSNPGKLMITKLYSFSCLDFDSVMFFFFFFFDFSPVSLSHGSACCQSWHGLRPVLTLSDPSPTTANCPLQLSRFFWLFWFLSAICWLSSLYELWIAFWLPLCIFVMAKAITYLKATISV